jgi:hypothetical protein
VVRAIKEVVAEVTKATKVVNGEGKKLDVLGVEGRNNVNTSGALLFPQNFAFAFSLCQ